jgi:hypothetical protein
MEILPENVKNLRSHTLNNVGQDYVRVEDIMLPT